MFFQEHAQGAQLSPIVPSPPPHPQEQGTVQKEPKSFCPKRTKSAPGALLSLFSSWNPFSSTKKSVSPSVIQQDHGTDCQIMDTVQRVSIIWQSVP